MSGKHNHRKKCSKSPNEATKQTKYVIIRNSTKNKIMARLPTPMPLNNSKQERRVPAPLPQLSRQTIADGDTNEGCTFNFDNQNSSRSVDDLLSENLFTINIQIPKKSAIKRNSTKNKTIGRILTPKPLGEVAEEGTATFSFSSISTNDVWNISSNEHNWTNRNLHSSWSSDDMQALQDIAYFNDVFE